MFSHSIKLFSLRGGLLVPFLPSSSKENSRCDRKNGSSRENVRPELVAARSLERLFEGLRVGRIRVEFFGFLTFFGKGNDSLNVCSIDRVQVEESEQFTHVVKVNPVVDTFSVPVATTSQDVLSFSTAHNTSDFSQSHLLSVIWVLRIRVEAFSYQNK